MLDDERQTQTEKVPSVFSQRWILGYLLCTGSFCAYAMRVNISIALVCMVKTPVTNFSILISNHSNTSFSIDDQCGELETQKTIVNQRAEFEWDKNTQSSILSAFFYGYIITQIPGGWLADRFGGRLVLGFAMAVSGISTVLIPVSARTSIILVYVLRAVLGLASGVIRPACYSMLGRWSPCLERSKLSAMSQVGSVCGVIGTFALSGVLCEYGFDNGWGSIFYVTGGMCCIWSIIWFFQVRDSPIDHPRITKVERDYIVDNIEFDTSRRTYKIPWKDMALSVPVWATIVCHMCGNWAEFTLITSLPAFMKGVLKFDIKSNGALSGIPYLCAAIMSVIAGHLADLVRSKHILTTTQTRKVFQSIAYIGAGIFLVAAGFIPCTQREIAVVFLCLAVLSTGFMSGGYYANHIDLAPKYAGILYGISNTMATIPGLISPVVAGALTPNDLPHEWRNVFYVGAAFYAFGTIFYGVFASGELQPWAKDKVKDLDIIVEAKLISPGEGNKQEKSEDVTFLKNG